MRFLALGGVIGPALFAVVVVICGALRPGYNHMTQFISELGAQGTSHAAIMNFAGFLPLGLLLVGFAASLRGALPRRPLAVAVAILLGLFGLSIALAGLYSCDPGCPQPPVAAHPLKA